MTGPILAVVLVVRFLAFPGYPPVHVERFETEGQCRKALIELDNSTKLLLRLTCEVAT